MTDKIGSELKPLTAEASKEFEVSRISDSVVQHKCEACSAWYETDRKDEAFQESFFCDCGAFMTFTVPATEFKKSAIIKPTNDDLIYMQTEDARLDSGMKLSEAIKRAETWWQGKGARYMQTELKRQSTQVGGADKGAGVAFASKDETDPNFLPSGLIHGEPWETLTKREKLMVVKIWHHFNVRVPDVIGEDPEAEFKLKDRGTIQ